MNESAMENAAVLGGASALELALNEMEAAIAESGAALLAGRLRDLESCTRRQQQLSVPIQEWISSHSDLSDCVHGERLQFSGVESARRVRMQNRVLAGVLKRMRRNLEALQRQMQGFELSYIYERAGNSAVCVNPEMGGESHV